MRATIGQRFAEEEVSERLGSARWEVIRYALDSNARTARLCLIWVVMTGGPAAGLVELLSYIRLRFPIQSGNAG